MSTSCPDNAKASWLYVWYDRNLGVDGAQGVARQFFNQGYLTVNTGVLFHPVDPSWFDDYKGNAGAQVMIDYSKHEEILIPSQVKRELFYLESPLIAFTWKGKADVKDCFVLGFTVKLGSTVPYEVWGVHDKFPPDNLESFQSAERHVREKIEANAELKETRVWCDFCHRMCYLMLSGISFHYDNEFELAGFHGMAASVCESCNTHVCGGCLVALSMVENASQVCPRCGKVNWSGKYSVVKNTLH